MRPSINLALVWLVIHVVFYRVLGLGFNFLSQSNLEALASSGSYIAQFKDAAGAMVTCGRELSLEKLVAGAARYGERAVVCFVLIGFFSYPFVTILFRQMAGSSQRSETADGRTCRVRLVLDVDHVFLRRTHRSVLRYAVRQNVRHLLWHEFPLVELFRRNSACSLGIRLVGMDDRRSVYDPERLADETLVINQTRPTL